jgi:hypothetical protein
MNSIKKQLYDAEILEGLIGGGTPAAIKRIMDEYPDLCCHGFQFHYPHQPDEYSFSTFAEGRNQMLTRDFARQVVTAKAFIQLTYLEDYGSYNLKHAAENFGQEVGLERYVSNGALIVAAIWRGYKPKRQRNSPNCTFHGDEPKFSCRGRGHS